MGKSIALYVTPKDGREGFVHQHFLAVEAQVRSSCSSTNLSTNEWTEDDELSTDPEGELYHDDQTLQKVHYAINQYIRSLTAVPPTASDSVAREIINAILNEGILFRERRP